MAKITLKGVPSGNVNDLRNYLVYLVEELTFLLDNIDEENLTENLLKKIEGESE